MKQRRLLLVTNALPPIMLADNQRARILARALPDVGWDVEVLTPDATFHSPIYVDQKSTILRPEGEGVHEIPSGGDRILRALGMRSDAWRALWPVYRFGLQLLMARPFDLIYISTAHFNYFCLGALWQMKTGVPYVLDYQDPWVRDNVSYETTPKNWKRFVSRWFSQVMEPFAVKSAAGLIAVSPVYLDEMRQRYPGTRCLQAERARVIPFGVDEGDYATAWAQGELPREASDPLSLDIVYVGAGRAIMAKSFERVCRALARLNKQEAGLLSNLKIRLFGTYAHWQDGDPRELQGVAKREGVGDMVEERPKRIGYVDALRLALDADGLLVLGVDDTAYMPSKLFLYSMTGKPLLACMRRDSQVNAYFDKYPEIGTLIHFGDSIEDLEREDELIREFLKEVAGRKTHARPALREEFSASAMAMHHAELFERCVSDRPGE